MQRDPAGAPRPPATTPPPPGPLSESDLLHWQRVPLTYCRLNAEVKYVKAGNVPKTGRKNRARSNVARGRLLRYRKDASNMGRPPQPPRSYVTRHIRVRRPLDAALRRAAIAERRPYHDLVQIVFEDWLRTHGYLEGELPPPWGARQPRKPPRKP